jgi:iron complex transport system ATP-binding protein
MAVFALSDVTFAYDSKPAIKRVSLEIAEGGFVGVVGPNGSGKSTLLKLLDGMLVPGEGKVLLEGRPVLDYSRKDIAMQIGLVPQSFSLEFRFTAREVIEMGRYARGRSTERRWTVDQLLEKLEIQQLAGRPFPDLSGGEKQMVVLAQALAQEPKVLLLDEPAAHLDVSYQLMLFDWLRKLNSEGLTIVCVLHDLNLALLYFEKLLMLSEGELIASGIAEDVLSPEVIKSVYGVRTFVHRHAGRTFLTFSPRARAIRGERIHLVGGGGSGANLMRELTDMGFAVSAGVVNAMDTDEVTGRELGLPVAAEAPFTEITDEAYEENMELIRRADIVILAAVPIGFGNVRNLEAVAEASRLGKETWIVSGVLDRDFTDTARRTLDAIGNARYFDGDGAIIKELGTR